jgi:hypothetical protein
MSKSAMVSPAPPAIGENDSQGWVGIVGVNRRLPCRAFLYCRRWLIPKRHFAQASAKGFNVVGAWEVFRAFAVQNHLSVHDKEPICSQSLSSSIPAKPDFVAPTRPSLIAVPLRTFAAIRPKSGFRPCHFGSPCCSANCNAKVTACLARSSNAPIRFSTSARISSTIMATSPADEFVAPFARWRWR